MGFTFEAMQIPDVVLVKPQLLRDARGYFLEMFKESVFLPQGAAMKIVQINSSRSLKGVVRGIHYQILPHAQAKLVQVSLGEIFDVAVDLRRDSSTFGRWVGAHLSAENRHGLFIPEGFGHGFCALSDVADVVYYCNREYSAYAERGVIWNDPKLDIDWPVRQPLLSQKDAVLPALADAEVFP
ncbi:MAG: dTDP-4-dehydrorhamnose 3,5-epimerase [Candidatus Omnitrophica bacterium]|nr:dTDP-4-dehydrorhamnose 3,5-epimerase [Candidatus Omnitrophota bacterium]